MKIKEIIKSATYGNLLFIVLTIIAICLIMISFIIPPTGIIDGSVLAAVGELFAFAALGTFLQAVNSGKRASVRHGETELSIENTESDGELQADDTQD